LVFPLMVMSRAKRGLLVLARLGIVSRFREEWPGLGGRPARAADRRIARSKAFWAAGEQDRGRHLHRTRMVEGTKGSHHKEGSTKMSKTITVCAGIDTGKHKLDVAIDGSAEQLEVDNKRHGHRSLSVWLRRRGVGRIGIEASGGYEQEVVAWLRAEGLAVTVFQPAQVRAYARFVLQHAKNDKIDAALIARCTAEKGDCREAPDARLAQLAQHLTMIEQLTEDVARLKTRCESCRDQRILQVWKQQIADLKELLKGELKQLIAAIRKHRDLADRLELIASVNGVGLRTAVAILVRLPEIGRVSREQAAALAGLAPYDNDSGLRRGSRHIKGGRQRLRQSLYAAALPAAFHWNAELKALYARLTAAGKPHKLALIACARKLLIFINTVVARGTPWIGKPAAS
jgi:transposase